MFRHLTRRAAVLLLVGCQGDNAPDDKDDLDPVDSTDSATMDDSSSPPVEECNGVDDNGDGVVDEDFPDTDLDGVADCVEERCAGVDVSPLSTPNSTAECAAWSGPVVKDPWNVSLRSSVTMEDEGTQSPIYSFHMPFVLPPDETGLDPVAMIIWDSSQEYYVARWVRVSADGETTTLVERVE